MLKDFVHSSAWAPWAREMERQRPIAIQSTRRMRMTPGTRGGTRGTRPWVDTWMGGGRFRDFSRVPMGRHVQKSFGLGAVSWGALEFRPACLDGRDAVPPPASSDMP